MWITKYRYKVLVGDIGNRAKELIQQICQDNGVEIIRGRILPDHVHIYISIPPYQSISKLVQYLKERDKKTLKKSNVPIQRHPLHAADEDHSQVKTCNHRCSLECRRMDKRRVQKVE